jgi:hypothetical protein
MSLKHRLLLLCSLSLALFAFGAQAQDDEPTMVILPDAAADQAKTVTENIVLPDAAAEGQATAQANRGGPETDDGNGLTGLDQAATHAAEAAEQGLQTARDAVEGARGDLGRAHMPDSLPDQVPADVPAVPGDFPGHVDPPSPPGPPTPPAG